MTALDVMKLGIGAEGSPFANDVVVPGLGGLRGDVFGERLGVEDV